MAVKQSFTPALHVAVPCVILVQSLQTYIVVYRKFQTSCSIMSSARIFELIRTAQQS